MVASRSPRACFGHLWLGIIVAVWLDAIIPFELFLLVPNVLAAPWTSLVRIDLGQVLFGFTLLRLATGVVLAIAAGRVIKARWSARAARMGRVTGRIGCVDAHEMTRPRLEPPLPPDVAEAALGVAVAVSLLLVSLSRWGQVDVGLSRDVSLGLPFRVATARAVPVATRATCDPGDGAHRRPAVPCCGSPLRTWPQRADSPLSVIALSLIFLFWELSVGGWASAQGLQAPRRCRPCL